MASPRRRRRASERTSELPASTVTCREGGREGERRERSLPSLPLLLLFAKRQVLPSVGRAHAELGPTESVAKTINFRPDMEAYVRRREVDKKRPLDGSR